MSIQYIRYPSTGSGGTVTSVGLSLPASVFTVTISPITGSGTLTAVFNTEPANTVFAGPASGPAAAPTFRALVSADIPSLAYVTSVAATTNAISGLTVSGSPITSSGTLAFTLAQSTTSTSGYLSSTDWNTFNNKQAAGNYITALTGDVTATGPGSVAATLATVNANVGTFASVTVNAKGLVTAAAALSGDATTSNSTLTLTTVNGNVGSFGTATQVGTFTVNAKGLITAASNTSIAIPFSQVSGTVPINQGGTGQTTKTAGFDSLSPTTTKGDLIVNNGTNNVRQAVGTNGFVLTADSAQATGIKWAAVTFTAPTTQVFTSGSGTYTTPANVLYIRVRGVGAGGGAGGNGSGPGTGGTGGDTTFGTSFLTGSGGVGSAGNASAGGAGGTATGGDFNLQGGSGGDGNNAGSNAPGIVGGGSAFGGFGNSSSFGAVGMNARTNTGSGGGAPGSSGSLAGPGSGGAGGYFEKNVSTPSATYAYSVGAAGAAGTAGGGGNAGGAGGSGIIIVNEFYQ